MIFDNMEQTRIENAVFTSEDKRYYGILITLYTGVRIGELCALKWENVDFANKCIKIKKSINRVDAIGDNKTCWAEREPKTKKSIRVIELPEFLIKILKSLYHESKSEYVISMKNGTFIQPRTMQNLHKRLLNSAEVSYNNFHVLRHTFATRVAELNTDPKTISETLGHSNTMITINRYTHSLKEQKKKMMDALNSYFEKKNNFMLLVNFRTFV